MFTNGFEWGQLSQSPHWKTFQGDEAEQAGWVWYYWTERHMKGYEQGRQYFKSTMNEQCGVQDEVCLEPSCDDINNPEKDCTAKLCFDPCDMDKRTCEFNYVDESGNQASSDCNNQLNDLEYWQNTRLEPIWAELFERDQQYIRVWYYLDEYHNIPETMDELWKDHDKLDEMDYDYDYDYERVNPACGVDETICL